MSASRPYMIDADGRDVELVAQWWNSPFPADRLRSYSLWSDGSLYYASRPSPSAVWSPPLCAGRSHDLGSARRAARFGRCSHESLVGSAAAVQAQLVGGGDNG